MSKLTVEEALALPGPKLTAWDVSRPDELACGVFAISAAGARLLAQTQCTGDREATEAEWRRHGLRVGAWYGGHAFVWVADELGCVVWSREAVRLDATRSWLRVGDTGVRPEEVRAVVSFVTHDWIGRGVRLERSGGDEVVLEERDAVAQADPTYNYNDLLMSDAAWVSHFGRDLAVWLDVPHRDEAFGLATKSSTTAPSTSRGRHESLASKLAKLREYGARGLPRPHDYALRPRLSAEALRAFEREYDVELPEDYALFLTQLGNGGAGPTSYPLYRLSQALQESRPERPFVLTGPAVRGAAEDTSVHDVEWVLRNELADGASGQIVHHLATDMPADWSDRDGCLTLGTNGCGLDVLLVLTGERRGEVWMFGDPGAVRIGRTFTAWYEHWLDREIARRRDELCSNQHLEHLARALVRQGRPGEALAVAQELRRRHLAADPDSDDTSSELLWAISSAAVEGDARRAAALEVRFDEDPRWTGDAVRELHEYIERRQGLLEHMLARSGRWTREDVVASLKTIDDELLAEERASAFARCDEVLAEFPDCPSVRLKLAVTKLELADPAGALAHLDRHKEECPHAWNLRACAWSRLGDRTRALACAEYGLALRPGWVILRDNIGTFFTDSGEPTRAAEIHAATIAAEPDYEWAQQNLGVALARLGRDDEALQHFRRALELGSPRWRIAAEPDIGELQRSAAYRTLMNENEA
ncbi:tetratricopeptide repeat protein [Nannocystis punicea]|uniref:Tetratricopeptide repeat protein n=1 Tax=Nannocystis punicea TaxID=2995304 RepID=A0ABY7H176_9BACT|nr:tetratricopeptide repeat protein [Nannocystis poenicansa]WAS92993.1 tetratricopeptide repeat protein [Nannocystis poenicansa]